MTAPLDPCQNPDQQLKEILDNASPYCEDSEHSLKDVSLLDDENKKTGYGHEANSCDPMLSGQLVEDLRKKPNRDVIYKYWKSLYGTNEAMKELFSDISVLSVTGEAVPIPIIWGTQEKAVAAIIQSNVRQDSSLVVNRIKLPMLAIIDTGLNVNYDRYLYHKALNYMRENSVVGKPGVTESEIYEKDTVFGFARGIPVDVEYQLTAWTLYKEDMDQIIEQIIRKFSQVAYIRVQGINNWEVIVKLESIANNIENEPGDQAIRVVKYQFGMKAETFISQPIVRKKSILSTKIDIVDSSSNDDVTRVIQRIENAINDA
jgi:hypothetical protein